MNPEEVLITWSFKNICLATGILFSGLGLLFSCGGGGDSGDEEAASEPTTSTSPTGTTNVPGGNNRSSRQTLVDVVLKISDLNQTGFAFARVEAYSGHITGCVSGYNLDITEASTTIQVQDSDVDCVFKLKSIMINGEIFDLTGETNWVEGNKFNITGTAGTSASFSLLNQLASPINGTQSVVIVFSLAAVGSDSNIGSSVGSSISVGGGAPIKLNVSTFSVSIDPATGGGLFNVQMECAEPVIGSGNGATCSGVKLESMNVGLALDSFGTSLNLDECRALSNNSGTPAKGVAVAASASPTMPNGGLSIGSLVGPAPLYAPENAKLILGLAEPDSNCKYFKIDIKAP